MANSGEQESPQTNPKAVTVDLSTDTSLVIDISDALSEQDQVKFTVHTKTTLKAFKKADFSVVREHEEFMWLHGQYLENEEYAGYIIPPAPPTPDFDEPRQKLAKLREGEDTMTKEEYQKMKQELEAEYLALFKKTVAMHEVFLLRLASHPTFRQDYNFQTFLEYEGDLKVRNKNTREKLGSLFKGFSKSVDESIILKNHRDVDPWFEQEKKFLTEYHTQVKEATKFADKMTKMHKRVADSYIGVGAYLALLPISKNDPLLGLCGKSGDTFEKLRKHEGRMSSDEDLKLSDCLRYYERDSQAALDLLYRRMRSLANLEAANKKLDQTRAKNKGVTEAEAAQKNCQEKFDKLSDNGRQELTGFKGRRVKAFRKNLVSLAELQMKHSKNQFDILNATIKALTEV